MSSPRARRKHQRLLVWIDGGFDIEHATALDGGLRASAGMVQEKKQCPALVYTGQVSFVKSSATFKLVAAAWACVGGWPPIRLRAVSFEFQWHGTYWIGYQRRSGRGIANRPRLDFGHPLRPSIRYATPAQAASFSCTRVQ